METSNAGDHAQRGIQSMNREHDAELEMVRALQQALISRNRDQVLELTGKLEDFADAHFLGEQILMPEHAYPGYSSHQLEHDRLIGELREIATRILADPDADTTGCVEQLERWMVRHIATEDAALVAYLDQHGASTR